MIIIHVINFHLLVIFQFKFQVIHIHVHDVWQPDTMKKLPGLEVNILNITQLLGNKIAIEFYF